MKKTIKVILGIVAALMMAVTGVLLYCYNLELEQGRYFYANGIMVGDFMEQNSLSVKQKAIWSEEVLKLRDSMRDLMKELK